MLNYEPDFETVSGVADFFACKGRIASQEESLNRSVTVRIPQWTYLRLKAIGDHNGTSLTSVMVHFLDAALLEATPKLEAAGIDLHGLYSEWAESLKFSEPK